jgi:nucleotide-binding universal stress UspA family protein
MNMYTHILFPVDAFADTQQALQVVIGLARAFQAEVTLLHSFHVDIAGLDLQPERINAFEADFYADAKQLVAQLGTSLVAAGVTVNPLLIRGNPSRAIIALSDTGTYDLIVMGRQGSRNLRHLLLGGVSQAVVFESRCSVLIVPSS